MAIPSATFTPQRCVKKFCYDITIAIKPSGTAQGFVPFQFCQFQFEANTLNKPFVGSYLTPAVNAVYQGYAGSNPIDAVPGLGRWLGGATTNSGVANAPYTRYCVFGSKLTANLTQTSETVSGTGVKNATNLAVFILDHGTPELNPDENYWGATTSQPTVSIDKLRDVRGITTKNIANVNGVSSNMQQLYMTHGCSPKKQLGCVNLTDDPDHCGTIVTGPTKRCKFRIGVANRQYDDHSQNSMSGMLMRVRIEYNTLLYAPSAWTLNSSA
jgi:hypothetical protein